MKIIFKISLISFSLLFINAGAFGQSANSSAGSQQTVDYLQAGVSAGMGGWMINTGTGMLSTPATHAEGLMEIAMGAMMVTAGLSDLSNASNVGSTDTAPTDAGLTLPDAGSGLPPSPTTVPPAVQSAIDSGVQAAQAAGIDPTDPDSVDAAAQNAGLDSSGGLSAALSKLSPEQLAALEKEKENLMNQFHISSVPTDGGGGGGGKVAKGDKDDLASLLSGLNGKGGGDRGPASVDGLSKMFNGDAIGVAGDNIFKQVSRRYQAKIQAKTFLPK